MARNRGFKPLNLCVEDDASFKTKANCSLECMETCGDVEGLSLGYVSAHMLFQIGTKWKFDVLSHNTSSLACWKSVRYAHPFRKKFGN